jgi:uridine kinase
LWEKITVEMISHLWGTWGVGSWRACKMKTIAVAAVTAGGKTTVVNGLINRLKNAQALHFDDYSFEGEVDDFYKWVHAGADYYNVWNLKPLEDDIIKIKNSGECEYLILDYPFAYCHQMIKKYIDIAVFIDTPLDIALARRILRDMETSTGDEVRNALNAYLKYERMSYLQMLKDILPSSDYVVDGSLEADKIVDEIVEFIKDIH